MLPRKWIKAVVYVLIAALLLSTLIMGAGLFY